MAKKTHYAVITGRQCNVIVKSWDECSELVTGFSGAKFKGFTNKADADNYLGRNKQKKRIKKAINKKLTFHKFEFIPPTMDTDKYGNFKPVYYSLDGVRMADYGRTIGNDYICDSNNDNCPF